jgi:branched-chain amino acid transport system substrate-binding protein
MERGARRKRILKVSLFFIPWVFVFALGVSQGLAADNVIKFGCAISLSGVFAHEGKLQKDGLDLWVETVNRTGGINVGKEKYKVEVVYYDDKSDTMTSTKLVEKLITDDKIKFIFGPFGSGATFATGAIAEKYKVIMIAPMGSSPEIYERGYKYLFGVVRTMDLSYENEAEFLSQLEPRPKTLAIIAQNSAG